MRRRLDLAAALVPEPAVLFLDEPTTGLDPVSRQAIWEEVEKLNNEGTTVFLTTQYLEEADKLADRVGIISAGKLVAEGTPDGAQGRGRQARTSSSRWPTRTGTPDRARGDPRPLRQAAAARATACCWSSSSTAPSEVGPIVRALDEAGLAVESLDLVEPTLDDVFVAETGQHLEGDDEAEEPDASRKRPPT